MTPTKLTYEQKQQEANPFYSDENIGYLRQHLQHTITRAAELRKLITEAKTATKRNYYQKKFDKINKEVIQSLAMVELMERAAKEGTNANAS